MKKWFLLGLSALTLTLAACSASSEEGKRSTLYEVNANVLTLEQKTELKKQQQIEKRNAIHYAQLYNTLQQVIMTYGIANDTEAVTGLYYAKLIDFNNDGLQELYMILKNDSTIIDQQPQRAVSGYVHEIWGNNGEEKVAALAFSSELPAVTEQTTVTVSAIKNDNAVYISELIHASNETEGPSTETIVAMNNKGTFAKQQFVKDGLGNFINGELIADANFVEARKAYNGQVHTIIASDEELKNYIFQELGEEVIKPVVFLLEDNAWKDFIK